MAERLFEVEEPEPQLSGDQKRTQKQRSLLANGIHPATRIPLRSVTGRNDTCGTCIHCISNKSAKVYWKCDIMPITNGPGTDIRKKWPACIKWEDASGPQEETRRESG